MATKNQIIKGVLWNSVEKFLVKGASFIIGVVLARLLSPGDYGLIGMLTVFIALSDTIINSGFSHALIQKKDCSERDFSTAFISNFCLSLLLYVILFVSATPIAKFYNTPELESLLRVLSLSLIIGSFNLVQRSKLTRIMDFKSMAKINFLGVIIGGMTGILMAYKGFGVWSLVGQNIAQAIALNLLFPFYSKWRPRWEFSVQSFNQLFNFGFKLMLTGISATIINNISTIAIGKVYRSEQLGYYTRAQQFSQLICYTLYEVVGAVSFPALSQLQDDRERMVNLYKKSLYSIALLEFPVMVLMAALARPMVIVLLTEKWLPCVLMLQVLCIARMFTPMNALNQNILNAMGRSDLYLKINLCLIPMTLVALAITIPIGVEAIVWGNLITTFFSFFINNYYPNKFFGYGALDQIKDFRGLIASMLMMVLVVNIVLYITSSPWVQLIVGAMVGLGTYIGFCFVLKAVSVEMIKSLRK